ncbi:hypothetical protein OG689_34865 [Kitasatospora sp. NBC_00240]|uniref:hypothetical protein n=1 Tax=Kitasatospora sp. NBC_00240 TaxID=2903567 RepID=UPI0022540F36|nr:hypothetical protein [Kitasatospora sp. NBC_00240]MCX5214385.1 hypothetical protein [Kitasatospora sp. NBC_00240]
MTGWTVAALGGLAALATGAVVRYRMRPALRAVLQVLCGLAAIAAFSLLMDVVTLMFVEGVDSWPAAANHASAATGVVLLAATAWSDRRTSATVAAREPSAASRPVHIAACAGTAAFVPYAVMKVIWATGGTFAGVTGPEGIEMSRRNGASGMWLTLESWGVDGTTLLAALGVFLLWGLVRPWGTVFPRWTPVLRGRRVPRWLPLTPALIGAATLAPYGVIGAGYTALATAGVVTMRSDDFHSTHDLLLAAWIGMTAFAGYGIALIVAARSYWLRTRRNLPGASRP